MKQIIYRYIVCVHLLVQPIMFRRNIIPLLSQLQCKYSLLGNENKTIYDIASLEQGTPSDLTFCSSNDYEGLKSIERSKSGIILCKNELRDPITRWCKSNGGSEKLYVFVDNPRLIFVKLAKLIRGITKLMKGISDSATISDSANIGRDCYVGAHVFIGDNCVIGDNTIIYSGSNLRNCLVGENCSVQPNTTIGSDGFAFERNIETLELESFPHYGKVIIENDVEIYANCSIACGSLSDTVIGQGTKIDALCHIAHNVVIGKNTQLTAGVVIGGSTSIGDNCWIGLNSTIKHKISIGNSVIVGSGSSVINNIKDKDIVAGVPAKSIKTKINLNIDKLFLMGGQREENLENPYKTRMEKKSSLFQSILVVSGSCLFLPVLN